VFTDPLPSSERPIVARVRLAGTVFTKSLPSNGSTRHNMNDMIIKLQHIIMQQHRLRADSILFIDDYVFITNSNDEMQRSDYDLKIHRS
jgi:hypothetical protein